MSGFSGAWIDIADERKRYTASSVQALIEGIYETESRTPTSQTASQARRILRHRIYATASPSISERELVKSAAKRLRVEPGFRETEFEKVPLLEPRPIPDFLSLAREKVPAFETQPIAEALQTLRSLSVAGSERWNSDRAVSAILTDSTGKILSVAWNTNAVIRNRHAEWNLCESLLRRSKKIPRGSILYTSLKPCRMCAARIWETAEDPSSIRVLFLEDDPGALARGTILESESPARVRYLGKRSPLFSVRIQAPL